jgi:hypothetical protein
MLKRIPWFWKGLKRYKVFTLLLIDFTDNTDRSSISLDIMSRISLSKHVIEIFENLWIFFLTITITVNSDLSLNPAFHPMASYECQTENFKSSPSA